MTNLAMIPSELDINLFLGSHLCGPHVISCHIQIKQDSQQYRRSQRKSERQSPPLLLSSHRIFVIARTSVLGTQQMIQLCLLKLYFIHLLREVKYHTDTLSVLPARQANLKFQKCRSNPTCKVQKSWPILKTCPLIEDVGG